MAVLGPNGAGKTTLMRMLACLIAPSSGRLDIDGFDTVSDSMQVRSRVGYMPESVSLYPEMRVREYLAYRARIKGLRGKALKDCVRSVALRCGIDKSMRNKIQALSKGYRQRVGLADALVADPDVLVLDEPTIGLDPAQRAAVLQMISNLADNRTVLMSSHSLGGMEDVCGRVMILEDGRLTAFDTPDGLLRGSAKPRSVVVEALDSEEGMEKGLMVLNGVSDVLSSKSGEWRTFTCVCDEPAETKENIFRLAAQKGWVLRELRSQRVSLESAFLRMTGNSDKLPDQEETLGEEAGSAE